MNIHISFLYFFISSEIFVEIYCHRHSTFESTFKLLHKEPPAPLFQERSEIITNWIEQKVDNFNDSDTRTWKMRYMENGRHFQSGGPIFIYVGGEWQISENRIAGGLVFDMAKEHKGYLFYTEHRYYGKSHPTKDLTVENLKYLSVDQSLADLAHFIKTVKKSYPGLENSKTILIGGSYSATMVAWFQRIYPGIATGSWASSAPLLAKVDFSEYREVVGQSLSLVGGQKCYNRIVNGFKEIEELFHNNASHLKKLFKICDEFDFEKKLDMWSFFGSLADIFSGLVQTHDSGNIENVCEKIKSKEGLTKYLLSYFTEGECNDFSYFSSVESLNYTEQTTSIMRQWIYQTCSEFGWYQTSDSKEKPFGENIPLQLYTALCNDVYGERFSNATIYKNVLKTNNIYGGLNPNVTNVIFTHGELDPWHALGLLKSNGKSNVIPRYAHCKDFDSIRDKDSEEMKASKQKVCEIISKWLKT